MFDLMCTPSGAKEALHLAITARLLLPFRWSAPSCRLAAAFHRSATQHRVDGSMEG
jgi:hypothetical protein